jgi:prophage regulatory protein
MRLLSMDELRTLKGLSFCDAYFYRLIKAGKFPKPVKLGTNRNAFVEAEIDGWIKEKIAAREPQRAEA